MPSTQDINVNNTVLLTPPRELKQELPASELASRTVVQARESIIRILKGDDHRLIVVVGPCSIHDREAALEYASQLKQVADDIQDQIVIIMRSYFEKPRTSTGWKGLINDPHLNDTFDIPHGLSIARQFLIQLAESGIPAATEMLEPITPQYIADLISLASIGARTTESPTHRQMASGLSMPVGYKNGTDGSLDTALNAMLAAQTPHSFLGIDGDGKTCIVNTKGNPWGHMILRGGRSGPNYDSNSIAKASAELEAKGLSPRLLVDCSHANSNKDHTQQAIVWNDVIQQRLDGNHAIIGLMLESNLQPGNQKLTNELSQLKKGLSITDACIGWEETEKLLYETFEKLNK